MKNALPLLTVLLFLLTNVLAYTGDYCVSGAGTSAVNGTYTFSSTDVWMKTCSFVLFNAGAGGGIINPCGINIGTTYAELRSGDNTKGYYYNSIGTGGDILHLNTINGDGTSPIPTITLGSCAANKHGKIHGKYRNTKPHLNKMQG